MQEASMFTVRRLDHVPQHGESLLGRRDSLL